VPPAGTAVPPDQRGRLELGLLTVGIMVLAINLRAAITSLPPVFPELSTALHLSSASIAVLAATPVACFGVFSGLGGPLSRAFGEERVLLAALLLLAGGLVLRGALPESMLFPGTILAGGAIALMNVLLPSLVKRRSPQKAGLLIGAYLLMLSAGAVTGSLIAVPVYRAAGGAAAGAGWPVKITLGLWALPALAAAAVWLPQARYRTRPASARPAGADRISMPRHALAWQVAAYMGLQSLTYYATLSWLPTLMRDRGVSAAGAGSLLALMNVGNVITGLLIPVLAQRARNQRLLVTVTVAATAVGLAGVLVAPVGTAVGWILLLGLGQGSSLGLAIFFTMARAPDPVTAASLSGFAQAVGYLLATTGPLAVGFLHTATGGWTVPVLVLLGTVGLQFWAGLLAGRARTVGPLPRWPESGRPASMTPRTPSLVGSSPKNVTRQVAPARAHRCGSSSGGISTITSKGSLAGRASRTSLTSSASSSGPGIPIGNRPSHCTARRTGRRCGHSPATHTGILGCCTGTGSNSPAQYLLRSARPWSSSRARSRASVTSPKGSSSLFRVLPSPTPNVSRPELSRSRVTVSRATLCARRLDSGVTSGPIRTLDVAQATAASVTHGSATARTGARYAM